MAKAIEKIVSTGDGATVYLLSKGNENPMFNNQHVPDKEGCFLDESTGNSSFQPDSVCCAVPF